ncbi:MAG: asparagine synthase (glutamine-hydrolyzing) [Algibacter sp.]
MCAINGVFRWEGVTKLDKTNVEHALLNMQYRGPDFSDVKSDFFSVLGHNRLSILDLNTRSHQPMTTDDGRYTIVFNGEIYNYLILKKELEEKGIVFKSKSDTEVLLQAYIVLGKSMMSKLRGMFAFVIWDVKNKKAFAARDRLGEKPFYFFNKPKIKFGFASNLRGVVELYEEELVINKQAIYDLLSHQCVDTKTCIYYGIEKVPPASYMEISEDEVIIKPYWSPDYSSKIDASIQDSKKTIESLLESAVNEQLEADVPVGVFLSGGVDSSIITALSSKAKKDITAITMSTPADKKNDESKAATFVAKQLKINHRIIPLNENCVKKLPFILASIEPLADVSLIPSMAISNEAKKDFKVMLSGDGGDEIFGGYNKPLQYNEAIIKNNLVSAIIVNSIIKHADRVPYLYTKLNTKRLFKLGGLPAYYNNKSIPKKLSSKLLKNNKQFVNSSFTSFLEAKEKGFCDEDTLLYTGVRTSLVNDFLFKMDSASMYNSIENRTPFLDHRIIDYTSQLTIKQLMPNKIDKEILKSIGEKYLPKSFFSLPKKGFSIPYYEYLEKSWGDILLKLLNEGVSNDMNLIDADVVKSLVKKYRNKPSFKIGKILYSILVFEIWLRVFHLKQNPKSIQLY